MASSQVEIASSPPFGCVLRDHNRRDEFRDTKWRKFMGKDRLNTFISITSDENENENSWLPNTLQFTENTNERDNFPSAMIAKEPSKTAQEEQTLPRPHCPVETPNLGAASLVQIWEKRLKRSINGDNQELSTTTTLTLSCNDNSLSSFEEERDSRRGLETEDSVLSEDWQSPSSSRSRDSESGESDRVRVADIIKRWATANQGSECERDKEQSGSPSSDQGVVLQHSLISPRIRGRQAFADLLMQMEKERLAELGTLIERRAVSRFPQRGRIQAMLRLRSLQRGLAVQDRHRLHSVSSSSITHLRERFGTKLKPIVTSRKGDTDAPTSLPGEINNVTKVEKSESSSNSDRFEQKQNNEIVSIQQQDTTIVHDQEQQQTLIEKNVNLGPRTSSTCQGTRKKAKNLGQQEMRLENNVNLALKEMNPEDNNLDPQEPSSEQRKFDQQAMSSECRSLAPQETSLVYKNLVLQEAKTARAVNSVDCLEHGNFVPLERSSEDKILDPQEPSLALTTTDSQGTISQETSLENRNVDLQEAVNNTAEDMTSYDCWDGNEAAEELEHNYLQYDEEETGFDWISEISRPRSYWEDRRQEWYYEMLNSNSKNSEIRQLLERGTVTSFLESEFREKMDKLMTTRLERQTHHSTQSQGGEEDYQTHLFSSIENSRERQREEELKEEIENAEMQEQQEEQHEEQEAESLISGQFHETSDYFNQSTSSMQIPPPSLLRTWSFQSNEVGDESDRAASTTSPRQNNFPSQSYYQTAQQCSSSVNHPSIEMELICELRGQMEQLYHEMSDLRKSLKSCMDIQMILMQRSLKHDVHSVETKNKSTYGVTAPKKGHCCICHDMKVDSLLYRCGHMCTCLKCAHELQWSSGKCPICCAAIVDVVRAYLDP